MICRKASKGAPDRKKKAAVCSSTTRRQIAAEYNERETAISPANTTAIAPAIGTARLVITDAILGNDRPHRPIPRREGLLTYCGSSGWDATSSRRAGSDILRPQRTRTLARPGTR